jgi:hypothetical protein
MKLSTFLQRVVANSIVLPLAATVSISVGLGSPAQATSFTVTSPAGGTLPSGATPVGGIVLDLIGSNNNRVTSQLAASSLFQGFFNSDPGTVGTQTGFTSSVLNALGGGLQRVAIRFTLDDGDTAPGNFNDNTLLLNGLAFGNWSDVDTEETNSSGNAVPGGYVGKGFQDDRLSTGWFSSNNSTLLNDFYNTLVSTQQVLFQIQDADPGENFYDFTQGIDGGLINVGSGPVVQPVPEPMAIAGGIAALGIGRRMMQKRKKLKQDAEVAG